MKYAVIAALFAAVSADQCDHKQTHWGIYKDAKCTKINKKLQKKYGHIRDEDVHNWSGDCETYTIDKDAAQWAGKKIGLKITCDDNGLTEEVWKSKKCRGDSVFKIEAPWGKCFKGHAMGAGEDDQGDYWIKFTSDQFSPAKDASNMNVYKGAYNNWKKNFCVDVWGRWNFEGTTKKFCLDPANNNNYMDIPNLGDLNDHIFSLNVGSKVKATLYQSELGIGFKDYYGNGKKVNVKNGGQYSSMRIYNADKSACLFKDQNQHSDGTCFAYQEKSGKADFDLHWFQIGDTVSSLHVPAGMRVHLYQGYSQSTKEPVDTYTGPAVYNVSKESNDKYSSIRVCKIGVC